MKVLLVRNSNHVFHPDLNSMSTALAAGSSQSSGVDSESVSVNEPRSGFDPTSSIEVTGDNELLDHLELDNWYIPATM